MAAISATLMLNWVRAARPSSSLLETVAWTTVRALHAPPISAPPSPQVVRCTCDERYHSYVHEDVLTMRMLGSVTIVGATQGAPPESAAKFSSGGFSNIFSAATYQKEAISGYLTQLGNTNAGLFNTTGRAYPDISAAGVNYQVNIGGTIASVSGTSASTPLVASMVALLNDKLVAAGKPAMGFLNPFLYSTGASAFTDITTGNNPGCGTNGFPAVKGWDPVSRASKLHGLHMPHLILTSLPCRSPVWVRRTSTNS